MKQLFFYVIQYSLNTLKENGDHNFPKFPCRISSYTIFHTLPTDNWSPTMVIIENDYLKSFDHLGNVIQNSKV